MYQFTVLLSTQENSSDTGSGGAAGRFMTNTSCILIKT